MPVLECTALRLWGLSDSGALRPWDSRDAGPVREQPHRDHQVDPVSVVWNQKFSIIHTLLSVWLPKIATWRLSGEGIARR